MAKELSPVEGFINWFPGALELSVRDLGYDKKLEQAAKPIFDPHSMYGLLRQDWHDFINLTRFGVYHRASHGKSAQSAILKLATDFFDKQALSNWLASGRPATDKNFIDVAQATAHEIIAIEPWAGLSPVSIPDIPFEKTYFAEGAQGIMDNLRIAETTSQDHERALALSQVKLEAQLLGGIAVSTYVTFARNYLVLEQYDISSSELVV